MNKRETVQALMDAVQKGDLEIAESMLADEFQFSGPVPEPINKEAWLVMSPTPLVIAPEILRHKLRIETHFLREKLKQKLHQAHQGNAVRPTNPPK